MIILPIVRNSTSFITDVVLSNKVYKLKYVYNVRDAAWFLSISKQDDTALLNGVKIVVSWELLSKFKDEELPPGELFVLDKTGTGLPIEKNDLGARVELIYLNESDIESLSA